MSRPVPPHGSEGRYKGSPRRAACRCEVCVRGHRRACIRREIAHRRGTPPKVPSWLVCDHIERLLDAGMTRAQIARAAHVDSNTITDLARRTRPTVRRAVAARILAVRPDVDEPSHLVPAVGARRRLQALHVIGHGPYLIARATGISPTAITRIAEGTGATITRRTNDRITAAYRTLSTTPGPSTRVKVRAARLGWHGPLAWDSIDDPAARPEIEPAPPTLLPTRDELAIIRHEDILHLGQFGVPPEEIAARLPRDTAGKTISVSYVREQLAGRHRPGWRQETAS